MEFRPYYLAREWTTQGHKVIIVGASFSHLRKIQPTVKGVFTVEVIDNLNYIWLKTNSYSGNGLKRIASMFVFLFRLFFNVQKALKTFEPDLIIASSTYPLDNFPARRLARQFKALYCYEVHDLWPLSPMELGGFSKYHPFIMVMQWAENFAYKHANFVVSMLPKTLDHMMAHGLKPELFKYIPNGICISAWKNEQIPHIHIAALKRIRAGKNTIVGYVGGHGISNALEYLVHSAAWAQDIAPHLQFVLVGDGPEKEKLKNLSVNLQLRNIFFLEPVLKDEVPNLLAAMDILYIGWHANPLYRFGISPNKLMDYMMAGKPIVHSTDAGNDIVREANCGISVAPENPTAIVDALVKIHSMTNHERSILGENGAAFVRMYHSYERLAEEFITFAAKQKNNIINVESPAL